VAESIPEIPPSKGLSGTDPCGSLFHFRFQNSDFRFDPEVPLPIDPIKQRT
jgi:hypothetical protein